MARTPHIAPPSSVAWSSRPPRGFESIGKREECFSAPGGWQLARQFLSLVLLGVVLASPVRYTAWSAEPSPSATPSASELLETTGTVEMSRSGTDTWQPARVRDALRPGDRLRTLGESRATLRLSDRSVVRIHEWSVVEIQAPTGAPASKRRLKLQRGRLFFLNRERPSDMEFETPLTTGAIRGTEFLLEVAEGDGTTHLTLFDGAITMSAGDREVSLSGGQTITLAPQQGPALTAALPLRQAIQWAFYYPGVLNPDDLNLAQADALDLRASLQAYREGALLEAFERIPAERAEPTVERRLYLAAVKLTIGKVDAAEALLRAMPNDHPLASALRGLAAAVKSEPWTPSRPPATATEFLALSYYEQSRARLREAREAAQHATRLAPRFGFAWARLAELQFGFGDSTSSRASLKQARSLSPRQAYALSLEGFIALEDGRPQIARTWFDQAIALDAALGTAWMGRALASEMLGDPRAAAEDLQVAAALEPQRGLFRSYLGKAWGQSRQDTLAAKEFQVAKQLDPADPTAWLYSALHRHQTLRLNGAVEDLERSLELNDNRSLFQSRSLLDRDRAIRGANLAVLYQDVGLDQPGTRAAREAVESDPANSSSHLFLARSLHSESDPFAYDLRLETPRQSELLVANLLAPVGGGNLSQLLSQQEHLDYFGSKSMGLSSYSEYRSAGDGLQAVSVFGNLDGLSYAVDGQVISLRGDRPNADLEQFGYSLQARQALTRQDSVYVQVGTSHLESGDVARHYDPAEAKLTLRAEENQNPYLHLGYHREWSPQSHTLLLISRIPDRFTLEDPQPNVIFLRRSGGVLASASRDPFFHLDLDSDFTLCSTEVQHLWESEQHGLTVGARYQSSTIDTEAILTRGPANEVSHDLLAQDLQRVSSYAYYRWRPFEWLHTTAGLTYDHLTYPRNLDLPPLTAGELTRSRLSPKLGFTLTPWKNGSFQAAWTRSLGGVYFDDSVRLEPTQTAGFIHSFRSLIPESSAGLVPGTEFETWGAGFDQKFSTRTYAGARVERLESQGSRSAGAFYNPGLIPEPSQPTSTLQTLDYRENTLSAYVGQLVGSRLSTGARYQLSEAQLAGRFPQLPSSLPGVSSLQQDERSVLQTLELHASFQHESGFFLRWQSDWYRQHNHGYSPDRPGDSFWTHSAFVGWRFPRRQAELRLGVINIADQDYRLNPLNLHAVLARERTFVTSLRLNF